MKKIWISLLVIALLLSLSACDNQQDATGYTLYYANAAYTRLVSYEYETETTDLNLLLSELLESMQQASDEDCVSPIPASVEMDTLAVYGDIATLNMEGSLDGVGAGELLLFYAAVTKALTQLSAVSGVTINVNGESVKDAGGVEMGVMRSSRFVNNAVDDPEDYRESQVYLYFASEDGTSLVKTSTTVAYKSSTAIERVVIEKLINGPISGELTSDSGESVNATLPSTLTLLGINIKDSVCYVNIDDKIIKESVVSSDSVAVYSIVNTLIELSNVDSVQITVNGASDVQMPMGMSLSQPFSFNYTIIK